MLLFGHLGLTTGAAFLIGKTLGRKKHKLKIERRMHQGQTQPPKVTPVFIDFRLVLLGSMLPDIIDKPIGTYFFDDVFSNGRIFSHTILLFSIISIVALLYYWKNNSIHLFLVGFGTLAHIILDSMWNTPQTLLWPLFGNFEKVPTKDWIKDILMELPQRPDYYIPEILGFLILVVLFIRLIKAQKVVEFLKKGALI